MSYHRNAVDSKSTGGPRFRRMTFYTEEELQNRQLYEAYRSDEVVIFPHFDCLARYINELEKYYAEHEDGSVVSDVEMYEKLRQLHQETPTNLFTVLARNGYTIPGTSVTCSTLFSTADPSIAWRWERPKFSDVAESWAPGSETAADSEITDVVKATKDQLAATEWLEILVHRRKNWRSLRSKRPRSIMELGPPCGFP